jgi:hypothetical protein
MAAKRKRATVATPSVYYIEWVDAVADVGWEAGTKAEIHPCFTIGFVIDETDDALCLALTWSHNQTNARMHIPKAWIKNKRKITIENKQRKTKRKTPAAVGQRLPAQDVPDTGA